MTPTLLAEIGEAIYGENWKSPMAKDLGVRYRTVLRWVQGEFEIPDDIQERLLKAAKARVAEALETAKAIGKLRAKLEKIT